MLKVVKHKKHGPLRWFNTFLHQGRGLYVDISTALARRLLVTALILIGGFGAGWVLFHQSSSSFLPEEDAGIIFGVVQLPEGATRARTEKLLDEVITPLKDEDGVAYAIQVTGFSMMGG